MTNTLTSTQHAILSHALAQTNGKVLWVPETLKGGAKAKTLHSLTAHGLINHVDGEVVVTEAGYQALGMKPPKSHDAPVRSRENSKQAQVISLLKRPEGATIEQLCEATNWQAHTVRGVLAGSLKKKLGLTITSNKDEGAKRTYFIKADL